MSTASPADPPKPVTIVWSIGDFSRDTFILSRGLLQAATSDNIQVIALAAAEAFGATVAISSRTRMIMEKVASRRDTSAVLTYLQAKIGWSRHDSAYQLARSDAGLRFIGLAAALSTSRYTLHSAETLEAMMSATAGRHQIMPTIGQLKDLLNAIHPKMCQAGFADQVAGAEILLHGLTTSADAGTSLIESTAPDPLSEKSATVGVSAISHDSTTMPGPQQIVMLVAAFARLDRLGDAEDSVTQLHIRATASHAWLYAFIQWCLGRGPDVVSAGGRYLLKQDAQGDARVMLHLEAASDGPCEISISTQCAITNPKELWAVRKEITFPWSGFVNIPTFGRLRLLQHGLIGETICSAVVNATAWLLCYLYENARHGPERFSRHMSQLFPPRTRCDAAFRAYLEEDMPVQMVEKPSTPQPMQRRPLGSEQLEYLIRTCGCNHCAKVMNNVNATTPVLGTINMIKDAAVKVMWDILAIALLENVDQSSVLLDTESQAVNMPESVLAQLEAFLEGRTRKLTLNPVESYKHALLLFGMSQNDTEDPTLVASAAGQVIYLSLLETPRLDDRNPYSFKCYSGVLEHRSERYTQVKGGAVSMRASKIRSRPVTKICNLVPKDTTGTLTWMTGREIDCLSLVMALTDSVESPASFFKNHSSALYLNECNHSPRTILDTPDQFAVYVTPTPGTWPWSPESEHIDVQVIAVAGNDEQRFFALAGARYNKVVVRGQACLICCLALCREARYDAVIL